MITKGCGVLGLVAAAMMFPWTLDHASAATQVCNDTIDFSTHGDGPFDPNFYKEDDGITFSENSGFGFIVGGVQGDDALLQGGGQQNGPIKGQLTPTVVGLSMRLAPALQGTAEYILTTFDSSGKSIARNSVVVTQDSGDPETGPSGYFTINMTAMSRKAKSFIIVNRFIRSSFPNPGFIPFGIGSIALTRTGADCQ